MINRHITVTVPALDTTFALVGKTTGGAASYLYGAEVPGGIIDRLGLGNNAMNQLIPGDRPLAASPFAMAWSTVGSTATDNKTAVSVLLQHGDSSGGGDMAALSSGKTGQDAVARTYFSSANSSTFAVWAAGYSTAPPILHSNSAEYTLDGAKRYLRPLAIVTRAGATTSTAGGGIAEFVMNLLQGITFKEFVYSPPAVLTNTVAVSTSTSLIGVTI